MSKPSIVALIPARAGSKRVQGKNIRNLAGHPLIGYTIHAACQAGVFSRIVVSTDSPEIGQISERYGAEIPFLRPERLAGDLAPDFEWIEYTLRRMAESGHRYDCFAILRPTSPFRTPETIRRAWQQFLNQDGIDSLRAVEKCKQHPGKMWLVDGMRMHPLLEKGPSNPPWHSSPYQALPPVYVQNASLEIAWSRVVWDTGTIAGTTLTPFHTVDYEGFDINDAKDWWYAEYLIQHGEVSLPELEVKTDLQNIGQPYRE